MCRSFGQLPSRRLQILDPVVALEIDMGAATRLMLEEKKAVDAARAAAAAASETSNSNDYTHY